MQPFPAGMADPVLNIANEKVAFELKTHKKSVVRMNALCLAAAIAHKQQNWDLAINLCDLIIVYPGLSLFRKLEIRLLQVDAVHQNSHHTGKRADMPWLLETLDAIIQDTNTKERSLLKSKALRLKSELLSHFSDIKSRATGLRYLYKTPLFDSTSCNRIAKQLEGLTQQDTLPPELRKIAMYYFLLLTEKASLNSTSWPAIKERTDLTLSEFVTMLITHNSYDFPFLQKFISNLIVQGYVLKDLIVYSDVPEIKKFQKDSLGNILESLYQRARVLRLKHRYLLEIPKGSLSYIWTLNEISKVLYHQLPADPRTAYNLTKPYLRKAHKLEAQLTLASCGFNPTDHLTAMRLIHEIK